MGIGINTSRQALALFIEASKKLPEFPSLEPLTIAKELNFSMEEVEKILACQVVFAQHEVFRHHHVFEKAILVFNDRSVDFHFYQDFSVAEMVWGIKEIQTIDPSSQFSTEVVAYIAAKLHEEGFLSVPLELTKIAAFEEHIFTVAWFLHDVNKEAGPVTEEQRIVEAHKHLVVAEYVKDRADRLNKELQEIEGIS